MNKNKIINNYKHGSLLDAIESALKKMGKSTSDATIDLLAPVDEFHIGGRLATESFADQLGFTANERVLDVGCGLGGSARYFAHKIGCKVEGIDLSEEYIVTGNTLNSWVHLQDKINLTHGSALELPYPDNTFDGAYLLHVGMNIENKNQLFKEVARVTKPGATFGIYDVMQTGNGVLTYPTPWAPDAEISHLATPDQYKSYLIKNGFEVQIENYRKEFALNFFHSMQEKMAQAGGPPHLGLHTLMQASTPVKVQNMIAGISNGIIAPVEMIAKNKKDR